ncbi:MAG: sterol desaturase family protein [Burkholderiales bacterium]|nr:sterol desaturase family protein [Burkholderiales bacterium]
MTAPAVSAGVSPNLAAGQPSAARESLAYRMVAALLWPGILAACITSTALGMQAGQGPLVFVITYVCLALSLFVLERVMPWQREWLKNDGQIWPDFLHTFVTKTFVYWFTLAAAELGLAEALRVGEGMWPDQLPFVVQVLLALVISEFGFYWSHRLGHEFKPIWRFHAVHHSVRRLWFFNTGRFHVGDTLRAMLLGLPLLFMMGAPAEVMTWISVITAFFGLLTHCNVDMRTRWLHRWFNTPSMHRWHHSKRLYEGDKNYGENLLLWDRLFGTWYDADYRPGTDIGIKEYMPRTYLAQLAAPLWWNRMQTRVASGAIDRAGGL